MLLVRKLAAMRIERAGGPFPGGRDPRIPGMSGLDGTAGSGVLRSRRMGLVGRRLMLWTKPKTHIGGQPLEQRTGVPRLGFLSFFGLK